MKGYNKLEEIDYLDTFSPIAKLTTVRVLLSIAAIKKLVSRQLDVDDASLHEDLEDIYMMTPPRITRSKDNQVCKLRNHFVA